MGREVVREGSLEWKAKEERTGKGARSEGGSEGRGSGGRGKE